MIKTIVPNWPVAGNIRAFTTTRQGGVSLAPYDALNLASHVGDNIEYVLENRRRICHKKQIANRPIWLNQTHSTCVVDISSLKNDQSSDQITFNADASYTSQANQVCTVLTADCLPVLFCSLAGNEVAAAHAGWRGLCNGILENAVKHFNCLTSDILVWLGPAIGSQKFEVGQEVKERFEARDPKAVSAFKLINVAESKYLADLYLLARQRLQKLGITKIYGGKYCTYSQSDLFYSYRRAKQTGRMATMIWFAPF